MPEIRTSILTFGFDASMWMYWLPGVILVLLIPKLLNSFRRFRALPPGPRGLPILGNALQIPAQMPWFKFTGWAQEFGPIFSLNLAGHPIIVLNTLKVAGDLLDRRSNIYSDRPRFIMTGEILTGGIAIVFARYGNTLRKLRRAAHEGFNNIRAIEKYQPMQAREAIFATMQMLKAPDDWDNHLKGASASVILSAVYGWPPLTDKDGPLVKKIHSMGGRMAKALIPGAYLVEVFPALKHLPLWMAKWHREGLEWHEEMTDMLENFKKEVEEKMLTGESPQAFVSELIETKDRHKLTEKEAAWLAGIVFLAGAETTSGTLLYFIQAMLLYPEAMRKAQAELDNVIGRGRIPSFEDQKNLPYIEAVVKETLRWRTPSPISIPRSVTEDDWYEGYLIPKGATIIANVWGMHRDNDTFPDFDDFRPDRFLEGTLDKNHSIGHAAFGSGRRICVGQSFANQTLFITIATILWALDIDKAIDSDGIPIIPSKNDFVDTGNTVVPAPFKCKFSPRFPNALSVLRREMPEESRLAT